MGILEICFSHDSHKEGHLSLFLLGGSLYDHHTSDDFKKCAEELRDKSLVIDGAVGADF